MSIADGWTHIDLGEAVIDLEDFTKEFKTYTKIIPTLLDTKPPSKADYVPDLSGRVKKKERELSHPGMYSTVFVGEYEGELVAIKAIRLLPNVKGATIMRRFWREAWAWWCLDHENVLRLYGVVQPGEFDNFGAMISPWCENGQANEYLRKYPKTEVRVRVFLGVSKGLEHLHSHNIVHGDLKPSNVVIDSKGVPKICDFGLLRLVRNHKTGVTTTTAYTGTTRYLSFELAKLEEPEESPLTELEESSLMELDESLPTELEEPLPTEPEEYLPSTASDVHALGCIGMEFIYSWCPYRRIRTGLRQEENLVLTAITSGEPPAIRPRVSGKASELWNVIESCWSPVPDARPTTCTIVQFLAQDYQSIVDSLGIKPIKPSSRLLPRAGSKVCKPPTHPRHTI